MEQKNVAWMASLVIAAVIVAVAVNYVGADDLSSVPVATDPGISDNAEGSAEIESDALGDDVPEEADESEGILEDTGYSETRPAEFDAIDIDSIPPKM